MHLGGGSCQEGKTCAGPIGQRAPHSRQVIPSLGSVYVHELAPSKDLDGVSPHKSTCKGPERRIFVNFIVLCGEMP
jgi:hypothetical protein